MESFGSSLSESYESKAEDILESYGIDKQSGIIAEGVSLPLSVLNPKLPAVIGEKQARHLITEYNRGSNRVEKTNDLVVATRQKHNGMSWSRKGSGALAIITATIINGEMERWITERKINYRMAS